MRQPTQQTARNHCSFDALMTVLTCPPGRGRRGAHAPPAAGGKATVCRQARPGGHQARRREQVLPPAPLPSTGRQAVAWDRPVRWPPGAAARGAGTLPIASPIVLVMAPGNHQPGDGATPRAHQGRDGTGTHHADDGGALVPINPLMAPPSITGPSRTHQPRPSRSDGHPPALGSSSQLCTAALAFSRPAGCGRNLFSTATPRLVRADQVLRRRPPFQTRRQTPCQTRVRSPSGQCWRGPAQVRPHQQAVCHAPCQTICQTCSHHRPPPLNRSSALALTTLCRRGARGAVVEGGSLHSAVGARAGAGLGLVRGAFVGGPVVGRGAVRGVRSGRAGRRRRARCRWARRGAGVVAPQPGAAAGTPRRNTCSTLANTRPPPPPEHTTPRHPPPPAARAVATPPLAATGAHPPPRFFVRARRFCCGSSLPKYHKKKVFPVPVRDRKKILDRCSEEMAEERVCAGRK